MIFTGSGVIKMADKYVTFDFTTGSGGLEMQPGGYFDLTGSTRQSDPGECRIILGSYSITGSGDFKTTNIFKDSMDVRIIGTGDVSVSSFYLRTSDAFAGAVEVDVAGTVNIWSIDTQDQAAGGNNGGDVTLIGGSITVGPIDTRSLRTGDNTKHSGNVWLEARDSGGNNTLGNTVNLYGAIETDAATGTDGWVLISGVVVTLENGFSTDAGVGMVDIFAGIIQYGMTAGDLFINNSGGGYVATHGVPWSTSISRVSFQSGASGDYETVSPARLMVNLSPSESNTVTVQYAASGGTAQGGGIDYVLNPGILTFTPGVTSRTIEITIINDGIDENDETIEVTLSNPVNAALGSITRHTYTIRDTRPLVSFDKALDEGPENVSPIYVPVSLSLTSGETVTADYNVTGGTATNGVDYNLAYGTLVFGPNETTRYINLTVFKDELDENPDETIEISLLNPNHCRLGANVKYVHTILPPVVQICPEGDVDGDCDVDMNDVRVFAGQWLNVSGGCSGYDCADFDGIHGVDMADFARLAANWLKEAWPVVINELMASNGTTLEDPAEAGEFPDWIELYNGGPLPVNLGGMYLTDNFSIPTKWQIPQGVSIGAGEYLLFWADDDTEQGNTHTNFKLDAAGEQVGLIGRDGVIVLDSVIFGGQESDIAYGSYPDASRTRRFLGTPTPGRANEGAYIGKVADTKFSHGRGFYEQPFLLSITCETTGAEIRYTLDGKEPNVLPTSGTHLYTGPIDVNRTTTLRAAAFKPGYFTDKADTQTYIFLGDVLQQPNINPSVVATYGISRLKEALKSIPTLSIVKNPAEPIIDSDNIPSGSPYYGATSAELIYADPNDGEGMQVDCQITAHSQIKDKPAYRLEFKSEFGDAKLNYPFFESDPVNGDSAAKGFDRIILRAASNMPITYVGDPWTAQSQIDMTGYGVHNTHVHLYINGAYRGVYNPKERPDAWSMSSYFGGDFEDYFSTNHGIERCYLCGGGTSKCPVAPNSRCHLSGDNTRFDRMMALAYERDLENTAKYTEFRTLCDAAQFADYTILFWLSGFGDNMDNNWYAGMRNNPPGGFMMFMWDAEFVFLNEGGPPGHIDPWVPGYFWPSESPLYTYMISDIWQALFENADFRMLFADRVYKHCFNGGALTDGNTQARWDTLTNFIREAVLCEKARWGGLDAPTTVNMTGHAGIFINALRAWTSTSYPGVKLYPGINPPMFNQYGGHVPTGFGLQITNPNASGTIYYTLDGTDPRQAVTGNAVGTMYTGTITLNASRHVKARVLANGEWSALNEVTFAAGPVAENLRITEMMYHPKDANDPNEEYIELKNVGAATINLNMVRFTNGVDFTFPSLVLSAGGYAVVVEDSAAFLSRYPGFGGVLAGEYTGRMDNAGERIRLEDALGQAILDFSYKDGWRSIADGNGFSLTIINPNNSDVNSWGQKDSWRASAYVGGSPGWDDAGIVPNPGAVVINEVMAHSHLSSDWVELYNTTGSAINIGGWFLSDNDSNLTKYRIADGTSIPAGEYVVFYENLHFGNPSDPGCRVPFASSENGDQVCLSSGLDGYGRLTGYREKEDLGASESDISLGRYYKKSTNNYNFVALDHNTPGAANAYPRVGPIIISEIMYHPDWPPASIYDNDKFEYVELKNISGSDVTLFNYAEDAPWKLTGGIDFTFPAQVPITMAAGGRLLIVKDPEAFMWRYPNIPAWTILGPYDGQLGNDGETLELMMPGDRDEEEVLHYIRVERVVYSDGSHPDDCPGGVDLWPVGADGAGKSLNRVNPSLYGNDPNNWTAGVPSPQSTVKLLVVNEFMASNSSTIRDNFGDYDDWIEICNLGTRTVGLGGMYLTDNLDAPTKWEIPAGITIDPGEFLLFWADGETAEGEYHTSFSLSVNGEDVGLFDTNGVTLIDGIDNFPPQQPNISYGRKPDGTENWDFLTSPSPGDNN
jgi:hypothetical protein